MSKLFVQSLSPTFRRAARSFSTAVIELDTAVLSFDELHALAIEPQLIVRLQVDVDGEHRDIGPLELRNAICEARGDESVRASIVHSLGLVASGGAAAVAQALATSTSQAPVDAAPAAAVNPPPPAAAPPVAQATASGVSPAPAAPVEPHKSAPKGARK